MATSLLRSPRIILLTCLIFISEVREALNIFSTCSTCIIHIPIFSYHLCLLNKKECVIALFRRKIQVFFIAPCLERVWLAVASLLEGSTVFTLLQLLSTTVVTYFCTLPRRMRVIFITINSSRSCTVRKATSNSVLYDGLCRPQHLSNKSRVIKPRSGSLCLHTARLSIYEGVQRLLKFRSQIFAKEDKIESYGFTFLKPALFCIIESELEIIVLL
jgi:hypothetical protein